MTQQSTPPSGQPAATTSDTASTPQDGPQTELLQGHLPVHLAIIMDGNGRWAQARNLPREAGHKAGAEAVRTVVTECRKIGIRHLTLYTFSSEN